MPAEDLGLLDTNVLLRLEQERDPLHVVISEALENLAASGMDFCYTSQTLGEFWNVVTRPQDRNGYGVDIAEADRLAQVIERDFRLLPEGPEVHKRWRTLLVTHAVRGVQVHDARLAASMYVHGIQVLVSMNVRDFRRYEGLVVIDPLALR